MAKIKLYYQPFYNYDSDSDDDHYLEIDQLDDDNYLTWRFQLSNMFMINETWDIITGKEVPPAPVEKLQSAVVNSPEGQYWRRRMSCWMMIYQALGPTYRTLYVHGSTNDDKYDAKKLWDHICERERAKRNPWIFRRKLAHIDINDFDDIRGYLIHIDSIIWELEFVNSQGGEVQNTWKMPADERTFWYINGLSEEWEEFLLHIAMDRKLVTDPDALQDRMRRWYDHKERQKYADVRCYKCKMKGHIRRKCPM
ncbi:hypothetical protein BDZ91DRAFT_784108 [Kalaharituber pfeilii]|nr:hypothetical protein BDZ91DRAFT_784108 [Kalaharituber pfeilii]